MQAKSDAPSAASRDVQMLRVHAIAAQMLRPSVSRPARHARRGGLAMSVATCRAAV